MNKTLRGIGLISLFFGTLIVGLTLAVSGASTLPVAEAYRTTSMINAVGLIFLVQGLLCVLGSFLSNPY